MGFDLWAPELSQDLENPDADGCVLHGLEEFREHLGGDLTIMMLRGIGQPFDVHEIDRDAMIRSIELVATAQEKARSGGTPRRAPELDPGASPPGVNVVARRGLLPHPAP